MFLNAFSDSGLESQASLPLRLESNVPGLLEEARRPHFRERRVLKHVEEEQRGRELLLCPSL